MANRSIITPDVDALAAVPGLADQIGQALGAMRFVRLGEPGWCLPGSADFVSDSELLELAVHAVEHFRTGALLQ